MKALRRQQDRDAIAEGIAQMEAGEGIPLEDARKLTRERLLSREQ
jgi:predicted transcriptional regulator